MMSSVNWDKKVVEDYRERIIVDPDNPILTFKASRDRYTNLPSQKEYAGLSYLGSCNSEDALTWNVFRSLQKANGLDLITDKLHIGKPRGLLLWTLAPEIDKVSTELQYITGSIIRKFDGRFRGQTTEPDVIVIGTTSIAIIECKLGEPNKALTHLWEGKLDSVRKRLPTYLEEIPHLVKQGVSTDDITFVYQLVRMAFYAVKLGEYFQVEPVVVSLANEKSWNIEIRSTKYKISPSGLWDIFRDRILGRASPRCESLTWQAIHELARGIPHNGLEAYLASHPCL